MPDLPLQEVPLLRGNGFIEPGKILLPWIPSPVLTNIAAPSSIDTWSDDAPGLDLLPS